MAKNDKLGKLLLGSALAGAAIGTLTYFLKKKGQAPAEETEEAAPDEEEAETPEEAVRTEEAPEAPAEETAAPASDETDAPEAE